MNLSELKTGQCGSVLKVKGEGALRRRLMEMGFFKGSIVTVVRYAPLKDPIVYNVLRYEIAIRKEVACMIDIELLESSKDDRWQSKRFRASFFYLLGAIA